MGPSSLLDSLDGVVVHGNHTLTIVWLVLNIWPSHLGLPVLVATIYLSRRVYRNPTFLSMCITWWIDGLASSLLFWSGHQTGSDPSYGLCLAQASLLYGVPAMTALSGFFLIHTLFYSLDRPPSTGPETSSREWNRTTYYKLVTPYAIWLASLVVAIIVGRAFPELVSRDQHYFFCAVNSKPLQLFMAVLSSIILAATIALLLRLIMVLYRQSKAVGFHGSSADFLRLFRVIAFGFHSSIGIVLEAFSAEMGTSSVPHVMMATMGTAIILIFGTQSDILRALAFWKRPGHTKDAGVQAATEEPPWDGVYALARARHLADAEGDMESANKYFKSN